MGYYIQGPALGKTEFIISEYGAREVIQEEAREVVYNSTDEGVVCIIDNTVFEAAGFCYDPAEFAAFAEDASGRPKRWLVMDRKKAAELSGYKGDRDICHSTEHSPRNPSRQGP